MIKLTNINKCFLQQNKRQQLFNDFNFHSEANINIAIVGENGSGKTTLLEIISGVNKDFTGKVELSSPRIGYMNQRPKEILLPWFTARKNILLPRNHAGLCPELGEKLLASYTKDLNVDFSLNKYPFSLSGGQQQIVSLLRALLLEPHYLILDEPFSSLDKSRRSLVKCLLKDYCVDKILIIVSHRRDEYSDLVDEVLVMPSEKCKNFKRFKIHDFLSNDIKLNAD